MKYFLLSSLIACQTIFSTPLSEIKEIVQKSEDQIDIGKAALILSKDSHPDLDVDRFLWLFNKMAEQVDYMYYSSRNVDTLVGGINTLLFRPGPWNRDQNGNSIVYEYDEVSTFEIRPEALFLGELLTKPKSGTCATLPTLWYVVADRLGLKVKMVRAPGHLFIRIYGSKYENIEATNLGGVVSTDKYIRDFKISKKAIKNEIYLKPMTKKEFISTMLVNNSFYQMEVNKNKSLAIEYLTLALELDPKNLAALINFGKLTENERLTKKAWELGFTNELSPEYLKKREEFIAKLREEKGAKK